MPQGRSPRSYELICIECGGSFTSPRSNARYCSLTCGNRARARSHRDGTRAASLEKICKQCGTAFTAKRVDTRFCSEICASRFDYNDNREARLKASREWALANPESVKEAQRRFMEKNGDRQREEKHRRYEEMKADPERWAAEQEYKRDYYQEHREEILEATKRRQAKDPWSGRRRQHGVDWRTLFGSLLEVQDRKCYLCGDLLQPDEYRAVHLDHDHSCCPYGRSCEICRRGLTCKRCNILIGLADDDPARLRRIADNLEIANAAVRQRRDGALF